MQFPEILMWRCRPYVEQVNGSITNAWMFSHHYSLKNAM